MILPKEQTKAEPVAVDFRCQECKGDGSITVIEDGCNHAGLNCPCATQDVECADCGGTGVVRCAFCGEHPASEIGDDLDLICRDCKRGELNAESTEPDERLMRWMRREGVRA